MSVDEILKNKASFAVLSSGGHPAAFLSANKLTFSEHFKLLESNEAYEKAFYLAITASLGVWHSAIDHMILGFSPNKATKSYHEPQFSLAKIDSKLWLDRIKDIERYIPAMKLLEKVLAEDMRIGEITIKVDQPVDIRKPVAKDST